MAAGVCTWKDRTSDNKKNIYFHASHLERDINLTMVMT